MNRAEKRRHRKMAEKEAKIAKTAKPVQPADPLPGQQNQTIQQVMDMAVQHHTAGRLPEAEHIYQQILQADPNQPVALHLLGVIAHQVGKNDIAVDLIGKAIAIKPDYTEAHYNLGVSLKELNNLDGAVESYRRALVIKPNNADVHNNLGSVLQELNRQDEAITCFRKALALKPDYAEAHNNLGNTLKEINKPDEAVECYHQALALKPDYAKAHYNLGFVLQTMGKSADALVSYRKAVALNPHYTDALNNIGNLLKDMGRLDEAMASYHEALEANPDYGEAHFNLGNALLSLGRVDEAFNRYRQAVSLNPQSDLFWGGLAASLETFSFTSVDDSLWQDLLHMLQRPTVRPSSVVPAIISALRLHPIFSQMIALAGTGTNQPGIDCNDAARQLSTIPLFLAIMGLSPIDDLPTERMLTLFRHALLQRTMAGKTVENGLPFSAALALQCFANEYVFCETDEEASAIESLAHQITTLVENKQDVPPLLVVTLGAYKPLWMFPWAEKLAEFEWPDTIKDVITRQISEPVQEQSLRAQIPRLTPIAEGVSQSVREQYEENPYPRWIQSSLAGQGKPIGAVLEKPPLHFDLEDYVSPEEPEILVAGCGTGHNALVTASRILNAHVLAVDLSLSSLSYAQRKTNELGFSNIDYAHADIMELGSIERRFDLIVCDGVLHHLGDPLAGWRILLNLLRPGGIMRISLYSETARQSVVKGRTMIAEKEYAPSAQDIRRCRQDIIAQGEDGNGAMAEIANLKDFFSLSECRDLLFHVQEHRFTALQIKEALASLNLKFLGFELPDQKTLGKFTASYPEKDARTDLTLWHRFENDHPETFLSMYQFWCRKM